MPRWVFVTTRKQDNAGAGRRRRGSHHHSAPSRSVRTLAVLLTRAGFKRAPRRPPPCWRLRCALVQRRRIRLPRNNKGAITHRAKCSRPSASRLVRRRPPRSCASSTGSADRPWPRLVIPPREDAAPRGELPEAPVVSRGSLARWGGGKLDPSLKARPAFNRRTLESAYVAIKLNPAFFRACRAHTARLALRTSSTREREGQMGSSRYQRATR